MNNRRYIELDSTYRNRNEYPSPADFTILISQTGVKDSKTSLDPVCEATPREIWRPTSILVAVGTVAPHNNNSKIKFLVHYNSTDHLNRIIDYYIGHSITVMVGTVPTIEKAIIQSWDYASTDAAAPIKDYFWVTIRDALSDSIAVSTAVTFQIMNLYTEGIFWLANSYTGKNTYQNYFVWNDSKQTGRKIISYDDVNHCAGVDMSAGTAGTYSWSDNDVYLLRKLAPRNIFTLAVVSSTSSKIRVSAYSPSEQSVNYLGSYIRFTASSISILLRPPDLNNNLAPTGVMARIVNFINTPLDGMNLIVSPSLPSVPAVGDIMEILSYTRDNAVPFTYTGSLVSQQEMVCYELELLNIVLPNIILTTGGRIAFYPYVYIVIQNVSGASAGNRNIIYSNNPNSTKAIFRGVIDDVPDPTLSPFIKIDGDGMVQTIKFKPNDNLKFAVYLPNGILFETRMKDRYSPNMPDVLVQISALFAIKRL